MNVAIFASGNGTNFQCITEHYAKNEKVNIALLVCNNSNAYVLTRAKELKVPAVVISKNELNNPNGVLKILKDNKIDFVVLAGFLLLIPDFIIKEFPGSIVNIHPALLPKFGGKGMYGLRVHEAVIDSNIKESGITIHYVNDKYDAGQIIYQAKCRVENGDTAEVLEAKVRKLELKYYPIVLDKLFE